LIPEQAKYTTTYKSPHDNFDTTLKNLKRYQITRKEHTHLEREIAKYPSLSNKARYVKDRKARKGFNLSSLVSGCRKPNPKYQ
jgi:hypothetical protein